MKGFLSFIIEIIDGFSDTVGRCISWVSIVMVITVLIVVVTRYFLQVGSILLQELVTYQHALVFLLGIGYTLKNGGHVRVDIFYRQFNSIHKALINLIGALFFLLPVSSLIFYASWDYVWASWAIGETSSENNGLPYVYLLKLLLLIMPTTLFLQGIAEMLKSIIILNQTLNSNRHK